MKLFFLILCAPWTFCMARSSPDRIYFETDFQKEQPQPSIQAQAPNQAPDYQLYPKTPNQSQASQSSGGFVPMYPSAAPDFPRPESSSLPQAPVVPFNQLDDDVLKLSGAVNELALNMESTFSSGADALVFSPLSVAGALGLVLLGANGRTRDEIAALLGLKAGLGYDSQGTDLIQEKITSYFLRYEDTRIGGGVTHFASGVFVQKDFPVSPTYASNLFKLYLSELQLVNFKHDGMVSAMDHINNWVANRTKGHIAQVLSSPLPADTAAVFLNVLYFEGEWESPFCQICVRKSNFYVSPTETVQVDLMPNVANAYFFEDKAKGYKVLGLPYKNSNLSMFFFLSAKGPKTFLEGLHAGDILGMINRTTLQQTIYAVPKMKLETTLELNEPLKRMGVKTMFTPTADLRGIADGIWVDSVIQKVEIEVSETGTKAAASTMISTTRHGRPTVRLDRPFIFMVYHHQLSAIVFWGTVYKPTPHFKNASLPNRKHQ
ncbi:SERPIN [Nesidiocoris tenuis]|uniref:SERPIN n=1 Tax=Nesidiocoris tenuis TaxID=355587 RepID=A0ABN7BEI3_9HEMI|nr:SERPIN [Nesidiocoris tenuis]